MDEVQLIELDRWKNGDWQQSEEDHSTYISDSPIIVIAGCGRSGTTPLLLTSGQDTQRRGDVLSEHIQIVNIDQIDPLVPDHDLDLTISPDDIALVVYTYGSTGKPKGVIQNHRNLLHAVMSVTNVRHTCADDRLTLLSPVNFVGGLSDIFRALLNGASLFPFNINKEGFYNLGRWLAQEEITVYRSTPSLFRHFAFTIRRAGQFPRLRLIALGGEATSIGEFELYRNHFSDDCLFMVNMGSTDVLPLRYSFLNKDSDVTWAPPSSSLTQSFATLSSGSPILSPDMAFADKEILLLNDNRHEVAGGDVGEIASKAVISHRVTGMPPTSRVPYSFMRPTAPMTAFFSRETWGA